MAVVAPTEFEVRELATNLVAFRGELDDEERRQFDAIAIMAFDVDAPGTETLAEAQALVEEAPSMDRLEGAVDSLNDAMARLAEKMASFEEHASPLQAHMVEPMVVDACQEELSALMADLGNEVFGNDDDDVRGWMLVTGARAWWRQPGSPDPAAMLAEMGWQPTIGRAEAEMIVRSAARAGLLAKVRTHRI